MAHFAEIDNSGTVIRVLATDNAKPGEGYFWLLENLGGTWLKTSYNTHGGQHSQGGTPLRKNFAGVGYTYDQQRDAFIPPKPFDSWILNEDTCLWSAPITMPDDEKPYVWDEESLSWVEVTEE